MRSAKDRTSEVNGLVKVQYRGIDDADGCVTWVCSCACSPWSKFSVRGADLKRTLSCGCAPAERIRRRSAIRIMPMSGEPVGHVAEIGALPMAA